MSGGTLRIASSNHAIAQLADKRAPGVPVVLDRVVRATGQQIGNLGPFVAHAPARGRAAA